MDYELDQFIDDCRAALRADEHRPALETIRVRLETLLSNPGFVAAHLGPDAVPGRVTLHDGEADGFNVYAHIQSGANIRPPHDHAGVWAIYGQAAEYTQMTDWTVDEDTGRPLPVSTYRLTPGIAATFDVGALHSIDYPDGARFVRVTGGNLDGVTVRLFEDVDVRAEIATHLT